jgi:hypothetical protein
LPLRSGRPRRPGASRAARCAALLCALTALAGCSTLSALNPFSSGSSGPAAPAGSCPVTTILQPLRQTAVFAAGAKPEPMSVAFYGILDDVTAHCDREGDALRVSLNIVVIGQRAPSARGAPGVDLQYFVALTGPGQTILRKQSFPIHIAIPPDKLRAGVTDHIVETIPLDGRAPSQLTIVLGFQQNPEVVDFYRHFRGR